jgi:O-acetyl-ADP-ribose deacetylase (regulator of RNase III)
MTTKEMILLRSHNQLRNDEMIKIILGDITKQRTTAIVNAANTHLLAGGGVCCAIHDAAGPEVEKECLSLGGCPTGEARITRGYNLPASFVIHAVPPRYRDGTRNEANLLQNCYKAIFKIERENRLSSVAIPAIGTGIYGYPLKEATAIGVTEAKASISAHDVTVTFCCFDKEALDTYHTALKNIDYL